MGIEIKDMPQIELVKVIEETKNGGLLDFLVDEDIYWVSYLNNEGSFVVDTFIDSPKYFNTPAETANYISSIFAHK